METPEENIIPAKQFLYTVGDLIHTPDSKTMGLIKEARTGPTSNQYKIEFYRTQAGGNIPPAWRSEWWEENVIHARLLSRKWSIQKRGINKI